MGPFAAGDPGADDRGRAGSGPRAEAERRENPAREPGLAAPPGEPAQASQVEHLVGGGLGEADPQSDQWLIDRARGGDPDAWEVLLRRHRDRIYRIALRMLGNPEDAEDVTQDVAVLLLTALAGFTGGSSFTTWLYRIVINRSINHQRRRVSTRPILESDHPSTPGPEQAVLARGRTEATGVSLAALPDTLRSALVLHEMEGLSYQEAAIVLGVPESTVRGRIFRARRILLDDLREWS